MWNEQVSEGFWHSLTLYGILALALIASIALLALIFGVGSLVERLAKSQFVVRIKHIMGEKKRMAFSWFESLWQRLLLPIKKYGKAVLTYLLFGIVALVVMGGIISLPFFGLLEMNISWNMIQGFAAAGAFIGLCIVPAALYGMRRRGIIVATASAAAGTITTSWLSVFAMWVLIGMANGG